MICLVTVNFVVVVVVNYDQKNVWLVFFLRGFISLQKGSIKHVVLKKKVCLDVNE